MSHHSINKLVARSKGKVFKRGQRKIVKKRRFGKVIRKEINL